MQEAYVKGIPTRKVDDLVRALGVDGISKSEVSRICRALNADVEAFQSRAIEGAHPYVWLDATYHKVQEAGRVVSLATVVAVGASTDGWRQVLGIDVGPSEDQAFWTALLRSLLRRGPNGVVLVISHAHEGLKAAIAKLLTGAAWQRCRVTSCATSSPPCHAPPRERWRRSCARSSPSPTRLGDRSAEQGARRAPGQVPGSRGAA
jgi:putative transposase